MRRLVLFLAFKHVRRRALQSSLTVVGVAVGVMVLITALSLTNGFIDELISSTLKATPHITLQSFDGSLLPNDLAVLEALEAHPEVEAAAPYLTGQALIARRANTRLGITARQGYTQLVGIDPELERRVLELRVLEEQHQALKDGNGIILGDSLALRQLGVLPGDEVFINNIDGRRAFLEVAGTFRVGNELIDSLVSYLSIPALQNYLQSEDMITGYHLRVTRPQEASRVGVALGEQFGLQPISWERLFSSLIEQLRLQKVVISVVVFLIVLVASMGIANILVLTVSEKTEEIAILRALGASERQVLSVFTLEAFLLGGTGTLLGALLGTGVSLYFKFQPYPLPGDLYFIRQLPVELQAFDLLWVCGLSLGTSVVAGLLPARRASNLKPVDILR
ncbi:MAG: ABC transporter permease [Trueperaceae bacterium]|nr:MAG: ABC transporter permease [Trueperaceae bacterium]